MNGGAAGGAGEGGGRTMVTRPDSDGTLAEGRPTNSLAQNWGTRDQLLSCVAQQHTKFPNVLQSKLIKQNLIFFRKSNAKGKKWTDHGWRATNMLAVYDFVICVINNSKDKKI